MKFSGGVSAALKFLLQLILISVNIEHEQLRT